MKEGIQSEQRLDYYRFFTGIMLAVTTGFTWKLWTGNHTFLTAPLFGLNSFFTGWAGWAFTVLLILSGLMFAARVKFSEWLVAALLLAGCIDDLDRLRPDFYQYFTIAILFAVGSSLRSSNMLRGFRIMHGGIYLLTGMQKLNISFLHNAPSFFYQAFHLYHPPVWMHYFILIIPLLEIGIGLAFLFGNKFRWALITAVALHLLIVLQLFVSGWNLNMCLYNLFLVVGNFILFGKAVAQDEPVFSLKGLIPKLSFTLYIILPLFSFFGLWPMYMSAGMYSFRTPYGSVKLDEKIERKLFNTVHRQIYRTDEGDYLPFSYWMYDNVGCLPNPEPFVYHKLFEQMRDKYAASDSVQLYIYHDR